MDPDSEPFDFAAPAAAVRLAQDGAQNGDRLVVALAVQQIECLFQGLGLAEKKDVLARLQRMISAEAPKPATMLLNDWRARAWAREVTYAENRDRWLNLVSCGVLVVTEGGATTVFRSAEPFDYAASSDDRPCVKQLRERSARRALDWLKTQDSGQGESRLRTQKEGSAAKRRSASWPAPPGARSPTQLCFSGASG